MKSRKKGKKNTCKNTKIEKIVFASAILNAVSAVLILINTIMQATK